MSELDTETSLIQNGCQGGRDGPLIPTSSEKNPEHVILFYECSEKKNIWHIEQTAFSSSVTPQVRFMGAYFFPFF